MCMHTCISISTHLCPLVIADSLPFPPEGAALRPAPLSASQSPTDPARAEKLPASGVCASDRWHTRSCFEEQAGRRLLRAAATQDARLQLTRTRAAQAFGSGPFGYNLRASSCECVH